MLLQVDDLGALLAVVTANAGNIESNRGALGILNRVGDWLLLMAHKARSNTVSCAVLQFVFTDAKHWRAISKGAKQTVYMRIVIAAVEVSCEARKLFYSLPTIKHILRGLSLLPGNVVIIWCLWLCRLRAAGATLRSIMTPAMPCTSCSWTIQ